MDCAMPNRMTRTKLGKLLDALNRGCPDRFLRILRTFFSSIVYHTAGDLERHYQNIMYVVCNLLGVWSQVEMCTSKGRIDMVAATKDFRYIFEFKLNKPVALAQSQILTREYTAPFLNGEGRVFSLAVTFKDRNINSWIITEYPDINRHYESRQTK